MKFLDQRQCINVWRFIQTINEYVLFISKAYMFNSYGHPVPESVDEWNQIIIFCDALYRRKDLTENLKQLQCRTLIFVGENSQFHAEAVHMTAKLDRRYSALVEVPICTQILFYVDFRVFYIPSLVSLQVQACGSVVTEEQPHTMLIPMEYFLMGYGLYRPRQINYSPRSPLNPFCISPELLSPESMGVKLKPIKTRANLKA